MHADEAIIKETHFSVLSVVFQFIFLQLDPSNAPIFDPSPTQSSTHSPAPSIIGHYGAPTRAIPGAKSTTSIEQAIHFPRPMSSDLTAQRPAEKKDNSLSVGKDY